MKAVQVEKWCYGLAGCSIRRWLIGWLISRLMVLGWQIRWIGVSGMHVRRLFRMKRCLRRSMRSSSIAFRNRTFGGVHRSFRCGSRRRGCFHSLSLSFGFHAACWRWLSPMRRGSLSHRRVLPLLFLFGSQSHHKIITRKYVQFNRYKSSSKIKQSKLKGRGRSAYWDSSCNSAQWIALRSPRDPSSTAWMA